ncbi:MAG TPA: NAD-dependent epimerase/dehydratase family protein [Gemmatimonadales bacterium]|nr:NAD-dependent epimerase/dehydratase family protein [Gemmatimonadales bacterium]
MSDDAAARELTLVTGATGFTGSHLVRALVDDGHAVRVLVRSATRAREVLPPGLEILEGDLTDPRAVQRAMQGVRTVYHIAAMYRQAKHRDADYALVHVEATRLLLDAACSQHVSRFVHCSTVGVHGHVAMPPADENAPYSPGDVYQRTKLDGELLARSFHRDRGLPVTVARPTAIYGPGDRRLLKLFSMIARRRFVVLGTGDIFYHMVHVDDLVRGLRLLATHPRAPGEVFILGGERYYTLREIAAMIAEAEGVPPPWLRLPAAPFQLAGSLCEKLCIPLGIEPPIHRRRVDFFTTSRAFTIDKAVRLLGYQPQVDLRDGIRSTLDWYLAHGYLDGTHLPRTRATAVAG